MFEPHEGTLRLNHDFIAAHAWLQRVGQTDLVTKAGTPFSAESSETLRGQHGGEAVIIFRQEGKEYARSYCCCWGHYYNCNRTRVGMYCEALDKAMG